jgi:Tfp pilus assembly protein PilO
MIDLKARKTQRWLLAALAAGGAVYALFFTTLPFSYRTRGERISEARDEYQRLSAELVKARRTIAEAPKLEKRFQELRETWLLARELLPDEKEIADLLRKVSLVGQRSGVQFQLFRPIPPQAGEFYTVNPVAVTVRGGYHQVGGFLAEIANLSRVVTVSNLNFAQLPEADAEAGRAIEASFVAAAYTMGGAQPGGVTPVVGASTASGAPVPAGGLEPPAGGPAASETPVRVAQASPAGGAE